MVVAVVAGVAVVVVVLLPQPATTAVTTSSANTISAIERTKDFFKITPPPGICLPVSGTGSPARAGVRPCVALCNIELIPRLTTDV
jgi:hypothetical protein